MATEIAEEIAEDGSADAPAGRDRPLAARPTDRPAAGTVAARRTPTRIHHKIKAGSILAARAATEYVYVAQDLRRILVVSAGLIALLFILWLLIVVMRVIELPFY